VIRDTGIDAYVTTRGLTHKFLSGHVDQCPDKIGILQMDSGWLLSSPEWLPITADKYTFLDLYRVWAPPKYKSVFSPEFSATLDRVAAEPLRNVFILGGSPNHYHLLMDFLPRLYFLKLIPELRSLPIVIDPDLTTAQRDLIREILHQFGIPAPTLVPIGPGIYPLENALVPGTTSVCSSTAIWTQHFYPNRGTDGPRRIFVMRGSVSRRRLLNQEEIAARLLPLGFTCCPDPAELTFDEQVRLFANAQLIVGVHGAALTNILFAPPHSVLVELYVNDAQPHFRVMAATREMRYISLCGTSVGGPGHQHDDFTIDPDALMKVLASLD
jgi:capsular polysaccharide biosynthesis protein